MFENIFMQIQMQYMKMPLTVIDLFLLICFLTFQLVNCVSIDHWCIGHFSFSNGDSGEMYLVLSKIVNEKLWQVESLTNQEEVELRAKVEALGLEVTKVPSKSAQDLDEFEIAKELDKLSSKLDDVDKMISSDPEVRSLLSSTADVWMPVITATSDERRNFTATFADDKHEVKGKDSL